MFRLRCHHFEPNRPVGVVVKHIAIGAGGLGSIFGPAPAVGPVVKRTGYRCGRSGFDSRDGQIGTVSPTARHRCDVSVLPKRKGMGPSDVRRGRESALPFPLDNCRKNETFLF